MRADQDELRSPKAWGGMSVAGAHALADRCTGRCGQPHWGYVISGMVRVAYPDHEEIVAAGDAYYVAPGHVGLDLGDAAVVDFGPPPPPDGDRPVHVRATDIEEHP
jgi:hypothetical protein